MFKKTEVVMLPTEKASNIHLTKLGFPSYNSIANNSHKTNQHLYFLLNEEIKVGDWYQTSDGLFLQIKQAIKEDIDFIKFNNFSKVIASTDEELGLPTPTTKFIQDYCELDGIDEVMIEYDQHWSRQGVEDGTSLKIAPDNTITIKSVKNSWNREEVIHLLQRASAETEDMGWDEFNKWIEENL